MPQRYKPHEKPFVRRVTGDVLPRTPHFFDRRGAFPVVDALFDRLALIVKFFSLSEGDLDLDEPVLEIHAERYDRKALLGRPPQKLVDLASVQEQFPAPCGVQVLMSLDVGIRGNMTVEKKRLVFHDPDKTVLQVDASLPDGLHLMPRKANTGLVFVMNKIVVTSLPVLGDQFEISFLGL